MIELNRKDLAESKKRSSKGNQFKWYSDNYWYKADQNGYEGLSEYIISRLLQKSNLKKDEFVSYDLETISYEGRILTGCKSRNFLMEDQRLITLQRLYQSRYGGELADLIDEISDSEAKCETFIQIVKDLTQIKDFDTFFLKLMTIDALFLNEDRHFHNIAFIEENGRFFNCPIFDNGAALLSDTRNDYPLEEDELRMVKTVRSKTLIEDFEQQLTALEKLYRSDIEFSFTDDDIMKLANEATEYDEKIRKRVIRILISQRQKYLDYFV